MFLFLLFLHFHSFSSFFSISLFHPSTTSSICLLPFSRGRHKMTHKGWRVVKLQHNQSGPSCSKLTTSLVNDSFKFTSSDTQICWNYLLKKMWKATYFFSAKHFRILYIESAKTVNEMTLNELVKLTTLSTTGPCSWSTWFTLAFLFEHWGYRIYPNQSVGRMVCGLTAHRN